MSSDQVIWQAILSPYRYERDQSFSFERPDAPSPSGYATAPVETGQGGKYLDTGERYQLLEPLPEMAPPAGEDTQTPGDIEVRVLDRFPFEPSRLEASVENQIDAPGAPENSSFGAGQNVLPAIAQTYLTLQHQLYPSLPQIHDAWSYQGQIVVLLEDRDTLPVMADILKQESILPIQVVHWFYEMVELWIALEPYQCRRSLLELENLRIDEDQILCLKRLYPDYLEQEATLSDLGQVWQSMLHLANWSHSDAILRLSESVKQGTIERPDQLKTQLEVIADQLQGDGQTVVINPERVGSGHRAGSDRTLSGSEDDLLFPASAGSGDDGSLSSFMAGDDIADPSEFDTSGLDDESEDITGDSDDVPTVILPMQLFSLTDAGRTDIGRQREHNEDCFSIQTQIKKQENPSTRALKAKGLYLLCDGMGGHEGGEVASALAVEVLQQYFETHWGDRLPTENVIREAIYLANHHIYELNQKNACHGSGRMGTTLVMLLIQNTQAAIAHVGDSRLYMFTRKRGLEQMTLDHEVGQREILRGVEPNLAYARPDAYQLTQALGPRDETFISPDIQFIELSEDTLFILCSDGLTDNELLDLNTADYVEPLLNSQASLDEGVNQLIDLANQHNGHDNITVLLIRAKLRPQIEALRQA